MGPLAAVGSAAASASEAPASRYPSASSATLATGLGFDACQAPSLSMLAAWRAATRYRSVGVYIGGLNRSCSDGPLSAAWVASAARSGWKLLPIYVGRQSPCVLQGGLALMSRSSSTASAQGRAAGADAVAKARGFGMLAGSAIYADIEGYNSRDSSCRAATLAFLSGWTTRLHESGYLSGVYSSSSSGIADLDDTYRAAGYVRPDAVWTARWNGAEDLDDPNLSPEHWAGHQRIHQYLSVRDESHGGYSVWVDRNVVDAPAATVALRYSVTASTALRTRRGPSAATAHVGTKSRGSLVSVVCQTGGDAVGPTRVWNLLSDGSYVTDRYVSTPSGTGYSSVLPRCSWPLAVQSSVPLSRRAAATTAATRVGALPAGALAWVSCQLSGQSINGDRVWNRLLDGSHVSDAYLASRSARGWSAPVPRCR